MNLIGQVIPASSDQPSLVAMVLHCLTDGDYRVRRAALEAMVTSTFSNLKIVLGIIMQDCQNIIHQYLYILMHAPINTAAKLYS